MEAKKHFLTVSGFFLPLAQQDAWGHTGRHGTGRELGVLDLDYHSAEGERHSLALAFEVPKPTHSDSLPQIRLHLLILVVPLPDD